MAGLSYGDYGYAGNYRSPNIDQNIINTLQNSAMIRDALHITRVGTTSPSRNTDCLDAWDINYLKWALLYEHPNIRLDSTFFAGELNMPSIEVLRAKTVFKFSEYAATPAWENHLTTDPKQYNVIFMHFKSGKRLIRKFLSNKPFEQNISKILSSDKQTVNINSELYPRTVVCMFSEFSWELIRIVYTLLPTFLNLPVSKALDAAFQTARANQEETTEADAIAFCKALELWTHTNDIAIMRFKRFAEEVLVKDNEAKINSLENDINSYRNNIINYTREIDNYLARIENATIQMLGLRAVENKEEQMKELCDFLATNKAIKTFTYDVRNKQLILTIKTFLNQFDQQMATRFSANRSSEFYEKNGFNGWLFKKLFVEGTYSLQVIGAYRVKLSGAIESAFNQIEYDRSDCVPQPHIEGYNCFGGNSSKVMQAARDKNWIQVISQIIALTANLNIGDSAVTNHLFRYINNSLRKDCRCFRNEETSEMLSLCDLIEIFEKE